MGHPRHGKGNEKTTTVARTDQRPSVLKRLYFAIDSLQRIR